MARPKTVGELAFDIVACASSAGGLNALSEVLSHLPADFPLPILVVHHLDPRHRNMMPNILGRRTGLRVKEAEHGEPLVARTVYFAAPNKHMVVTANHTLALLESEQVHFVRPSADMLFTSVAAAYQERAIAVVLSGTGRDGEEGVRLIKQHGGTIIAQDKSTSEFFGMPDAAIQTGKVDFVLPLNEIASRLIMLVLPVAS